MSVEATMCNRAKMAKNSTNLVSRYRIASSKNFPEYLARMGVRTKYLAIKEEELERLSR